MLWSVLRCTINISGISLEKMFTALIHQHLGRPAGNPSPPAPCRDTSSPILDCGHIGSSYPLGDNRRSLWLCIVLHFSLGNSWLVVLTSQRWTGGARAAAIQAATSNCPPLEELRRQKGSFFLWLYRLSMSEAS